MIKISFLFLVVLYSLGACKTKRPSLSGDEAVEMTDFIDFFPVVKLPYQVSDSTFARKDNDSLLISYKVFTQFVPDSVMAKIYGKNVKPRIYPLAHVKGEDSYLFVKTITPGGRSVLLACFDKKKQFIAAMPFLREDALATTQQISVIDKGYGLNKSISRKNADGSTSEGKDVYALNREGHDFTLIMTDALDEKVAELINPIDTLPRKQKFSADYGSGKNNLVSIRDGRRNDRVNFFIHFERNGGQCTGELKGEAILRANGKASYQEAGDPCELQFTFTGSSVTIKELEGCGSRRGLRCSFDGTYPRKKEPKPSKPKTTKK